MTPIPAGPQHFEPILALNEAAVHALSPLTRVRLEHVHAHAARHTVVVDAHRVVAFLLAFASGAPYDSVNYRWFDRRWADFLYVDRVVVAPEAQRRGLAALLYRDLFAAAAERGFAQVVCEFDVDPPNPASQAFHRRFGFVEVGRQRIAGGRKQVSLQRAPVGGPLPS